MADDTLTFSDMTAEEMLAEQRRLEDEAIVAARLREPVPEFDPTYAVPAAVAPQAAPPIPSPVGIQPPAAPLNLPVSAGRMYMGPMLSAQEEAAFRASPSPTSINLMPPPVVQSELERLRAADLPGSRTISIRRDVPIPMPENPALLRSATIQEYQRMRNAGVPETEARSRSGVDIVGSQFGRYGMMTPFQEQSLAARARDQEIKESAQRLREQAQASKGESATLSSVNAEITANEKKMQKLAEEGSLDTESAKATADRQMQLLDERTRLLKTISSPTATAPVSVTRIRVKSPAGKVGFVPSNQLAAALRQGYTQVR